MKSKSLSLYDIAFNEEEYVKDSTSEAFETLFSIIDELDGVLPLYENVEFDDESFIPLFSSYSFIETALLHLDDLMDDILDVTSTLEELGKTPGKDQAEGKVTYISFYGLEESKKQVASLCKQACDILKQRDIKSDILTAIANSINERVN